MSEDKSNNGPFKSTSESSATAASNLAANIDVTAKKEKIGEQLPRIRKARQNAQKAIQSIDERTEERKMERLTKDAPGWLKGAKPKTEAQREADEMPDWLKQKEQDTPDNIGQ